MVRTPSVPSPPPPDRLATFLVEAIAGRPRALHDLLARGSRLPGTRANDALAEAFAQLCKGRGRAADPVALALAQLSPDAAPGASPLEFLPVCGVLALGARAAGDDTVRARFVSELHARADDSRFRVRDAVVVALARVGEARGDSLVKEVAPWMDGYFHAAAVLRALAYPSWLGAIKDIAPVLGRLDEAFLLAKDAPRAAARYPGHKALMVALTETPGVLATRFGVPLFDLLVRWAATDHPVMRTVPTAVLENARLGSRFSPEIARLRAALAASLPPPRNPDHDFGPTRKRGSKR
jgi:hypothetical protein